DLASRLLAQSVQADLAEVGVRADIEIIADVTLDAMRGRGDFDLITAGWGADFPDASNFFVPFDSRWIHPTAALNYGRYRNPALDALLDTAARETDETRRIALLRRAEQLVHDDCPWIFMPSRLYAQVRQPDIHLGPLDPLWQFDLRDAWRSP